jgi:hypothetical protein
MTAKEFVKEKFPNARVEKHVKGRIVGEPYWLIRDGRATMYMAIGTSESNAWVNAKNKIIEKQNNF